MSSFTDLVMAEVSKQKTEMQSAWPDRKQDLDSSNQPVLTEPMIKNVEQNKKVSEEKNSDGTDIGRKDAVYQSGEGKYHINIADAFDVSLNTNE
jgi:hypothetical protein